MWGRIFFSSCDPPEFQILATYWQTALENSTEVWDVLPTEPFSQGP